MQHPPTTRNTSIGSAFLTSGTAAINAHHADTRRFANVELARLKTEARHDQGPSPMRRWLGTSMIWLGTAVAGKAARMQGRDASLPAPPPKTPLAAPR